MFTWPEKVKLFSRSELSETRMNCLDLSRVELDILVLANLDAHHHSVSSNASSNATSPRGCIDYY